eukprot:NODE_10593_length_282_cov_12.845494_g8824_i0.p2 GENE.NODE_10593_length_282_cov_12.845494_g8824_i0~~NODE_10593_length_282_cov_12.845494_g8824_i0.p2  ORF type:complete len:77 (-),score=11.07 NODE_10593_length_282_cov_12.845494_g8824_i0:50-259(-)
MGKKKGTFLCFLHTAPGAALFLSPAACSPCGTKVEMLELSSIVLPSPPSPLPTHWIRDRPLNPHGPLDI